MKTIRILLIAIAVLVIAFLLTFNRENVFRQFHAGMTISKYNRLLFIYSKIGMIDSEMVNKNKQSCFHWRNYKVYIDYLNTNGALKHVERINFAFSPAATRHLSAADLDEVIDYFKKQYGAPTKINLKDTTCFGYEYAEWTNQTDEIIKLEFNRDTTGRNGKIYGDQFLLTIKPTRSTDSIIQKAEWDKHEHSLTDTFKYFPEGWTFSANPNEDKYFKQVIYAHNRDSVIHFAQNDFGNRKYYIFDSGYGYDKKFCDYALKKYRLMLIPIGDVPQIFRKARLYNETMMGLLKKNDVPSLFDIAIEVKRGSK